MKALSRNAGFICLLLFTVGVIGLFVPPGGIRYAGPVLQILNRIDVYILTVGYGLLLLTVHIFWAKKGLVSKPAPRPQLTARSAFGFQRLGCGVMRKYGRSAL